LNKISQKEFEVAKSLTAAWTIGEAARITRIPRSTVKRIVESIKQRGRIYFRVNYKMLNLLPLAILAEPFKVGKMPQYTLSVRKLYGLKPLYLIVAVVPTAYFETYIEELEKTVKIVEIIRGYEYSVWNFEDGFYKYIPEEKRIVPDFGKLFDVIDALSWRVEKWPPDKRSPDKIDLAIIQGRMVDAFMRPYRAVKKALKDDPTFPKVTVQAISYHVRRHVKPAWIGNSVGYFYDPSEVPLRVYYFRGDAAKSAARALVKIPSFFNAFIENDKALVVGQPPCNIQEDIYKVLQKVKAEMPYGELLVDSSVVYKRIPKYWMYVENGEWTWKSQLYELEESTDTTPREFPP